MTQRASTQPGAASDQRGPAPNAISVINGNPLAEADARDADWRAYPTIRRKVIGASPRTGCRSGSSYWAGLGASRN
jgi:hypothetical protein